ncbi:MAG: exodeoxyribonuclease [Myxococcaceae bacterium]|nr:exodeoxyribonuclease [Myxococcaceae bacterium]
MRTVTWNINSIRARTEQLLDVLKRLQPDVMLLQELKCTDAQFPTAEVQAAGYHCAVFGQKSFNGVALLSREPPTDVVRNISDGAEDLQARLIGATVRGVRFFGLYAPNGQSVGSEAFEYKLHWFTRLRRFLAQRHTPESKLLLCGDFNVAPEDLDVWDPRLFAGQTLFTDSEKRAWRELRDSLQLTDVFRALHPGLAQFTWWDYRLSGYAKNHGLRIDQVLTTPPLTALARASGVDLAARELKLPSDHAPLWADFDM